MHLGLIESLIKFKHLKMNLLLSFFLSKKNKTHVEILKPIPIFRLSLVTYIGYSCTNQS